MTSAGPASIAGPRRGVVTRLSRVLVAGLCGVVALAAAEPTGAVVEGPIVELPKFEVTDSRLLPPPEKWLYAEIPGFEILSSLSKRATQRFVHDFLLLQEAMNVIMPGLCATLRLMRKRKYAA
jgi:hypothetical protein